MLLLLLLLVVDKLDVDEDDKADRFSFRLLMDRNAEIIRSLSELLSLSSAISSFSSETSSP